MLLERASLGQVLEKTFSKYGAILVERDLEAEQMENFRLGYKFTIDVKKLIDEIVTFHSSFGLRYFPQKSDITKLFFNRDDSHIMVNLTWNTHQTQITSQVYPFSL